LTILRSRGVRAFFALVAFALLQACGGGGSGNSASSGGATTPAAPTLTLSSSSSTISAASPATLTATFLNATGTPVSGAVVTFTTTGTGFGTFFPTGGTALTNSSGVATIALNAGATTGADSVRASATVNGVIATSNVVGYSVSSTPITQTPASISFISAMPSTVAIRGTGGQENSSIQFLVRDSNGNAIANQSVTFSLNTSVGGVALSATTATSAADGTVTALLRAGTTATPVRVTASLTSNPSISTVSSQLVVSTAIPHQNGFSIAASKLNIEAWRIDGVTTTITARLSDRYGNLVPDGTAVSFRTEGGVSSITPSCTTTGGSCAVTLTSSGTRPIDGRLTVLATAIGEESFVDLNGNGVYDLGEPFTDLPEAYVDADENGTRGAGEEFVDFNRDGLYTFGDGVFNGVLRACDLQGTTAVPIPPGCPAGPPAKTINVRYSLVIVLSDGVANFTGVPPTIALSSAGCPSSAADTNFTVSIADLNGNPLAGGTTVTVTTTNGTIGTPTALTLPDLVDRIPYSFPVSIRSDCTPSSGSLTISVRSPSGLVTTVVRPVSD
jgi:Invasin, domain 3